MPIASPLSPISPQAQAMASLFDLVMVISAGIFALVTGFILLIVVRYRSRPGMGEPRQRFGSPRLEITWTLGSLAIVGVLFGFTLHTMHTVAPAVGTHSPDLVVTGHQWWWEVSYPRTHVITANEIHVPVGQKWLVRLQSADVIHDFWVPQLGQKMDAVPGRPTHLWIEPRRLGTYLGACSEFCGTQHAWMRLRVVVQSQNAFEAWQRQQQRIPATPEAGIVAQGAQLFQQKTCVNCHAIAGTEAQGNIGPDLTHLSSRQTLGAGILDNTRDNLANWLDHPQQIKPGIHMPNLRLSQTEVQALVAYLWRSDHE
jgi:cytochrome c oxidase subunit 2